MVSDDVPREIIVTIQSSCQIIKVDYDNKKDSMLNELLEEARIKGYFDLSQIEFAIMEANGEMSFLPFIFSNNSLFV